MLLKCQDQTPAVDVWSAGIILLAFLTRRFPVFNANSDMEALLELMIIFGKAKIARAALLHSEYGVAVIVVAVSLRSQTDLTSLCQTALSTALFPWTILTAGASRTSSSTSTRLS